MSVRGLCQICGSATAEFRCETCGELVCMDHYEPATGRCSDCAGPGAGRRL